VAEMYRYVRYVNVYVYVHQVRTSAELELFGPKENVHVRRAIGD
jgi:hypothetical protein